MIGRKGFGLVRYGDRKLGCVFNGSCLLQQFDSFTWHYKWRFK